MCSESAERNWRLGAVSYLNAKPLIAGLDGSSNLQVVFDVPARLSELLATGSVDAALVPVIDLVQPGRDWQIFSNACIGCDGETLTVRVFSRVPSENIRTLHVDGDSHTSIALARVVWREHFGTELKMIPYTGKETAGECEAILLIGDKVVTDRLPNHEIETDLGSVWKSMTSLPFVFAVWAAPRDTDVYSLADRLERARDEGVRSAELIAADFGPGMGWPVAMAKRYLTKRLEFTMTDRHREGLMRFLELAVPTVDAIQRRELLPL